MHFFLEIRCNEVLLYAPTQKSPSVADKKHWEEESDRNPRLNIS